MKLSPSETFTVVGEYAGAVLAIAAVCTLHALKKLPRPLFHLFWVGFLLACVWEFAHEIGGSAIITKSKAIQAYIPGPIYALLHSVYDACLFLLGTGICYGVLSAYYRGDHRRVKQGLSKFSPALFFIFVAYAVGQELVVERVFNGKWWNYTVSRHNPILIKPNITMLPVLEWLVASILYYAIQTCLYKSVLKSDSVIFPQPQLMQQHQQ